MRIENVGFIGLVTPKNVTDMIIANIVLII